jgi:hypothetical protein
VQSVKTAERLGLLIQEVQAFFMMQRRWVFLTPFITPFAGLGLAL